MFVANRRNLAVLDRDVANTLIEFLPSMTRPLIRKSYLVRALATGATSAPGPATLDI
jgi:hypothetical protein